MADKTPAPISDETLAKIAALERVMKGYVQGNYMDAAVAYSSATSDEWPAVVARLRQTEAREKRYREALLGITAFASIEGRMAREALASLETDNG